MLIQQSRSTKDTLMMYYFTMRNEETGDVVVVDDDRFLLVFLDGVLQERQRAYTINESSITFKQAPRSGQKVDLVLLIGDSVDQLLSAYNFESSKFYNEITVSVTGPDSAQGKVGAVTTEFSNPENLLAAYLHVESELSRLREENESMRQELERVRQNRQAGREYGLKGGRPRKKQ